MGWLAFIGRETACNNMKGTSNNLDYTCFLIGSPLLWTNFLKFAEISHFSHLLNRPFYQTPPPVRSLSVRSPLSAQFSDTSNSQIDPCYIKFRIPSRVNIRCYSTFDLSITVFSDSSNCVRMKGLKTTFVTPASAARVVTCPVSYP